MHSKIIVAYAQLYRTKYKYNLQSIVKFIRQSRNTSSTLVQTFRAKKDRVLSSNWDRDGMGYGNKNGDWRFALTTKVLLVKMSQDDPLYPYSKNIDQVDSDNNTLGESNMIKEKVITVINNP